MPYQYYYYVKQLNFAYKTSTLYNFGCDPCTMPSKQYKP